MKKLPTAEEFINKNSLEFLARPQNILIEFAKLHVEEQAKIISKLDFESIDHPEANDYKEAIKLTILQAYPIENIK
jgi:hypothetical protein